MPDIVLFQPRVGDMDSVRTKPALPLALLHASTLVDKKYDVQIIDERVNRDWKHDLEGALEGDVICFGTTSMTGAQIRHALRASELVKSRSDVPVVWGGIHASILPEQTLENPNIDYIVQGEGEVTFLELARALEAGNTIDGIEGVWYKNVNGMSESFCFHTVAELRSANGIKGNALRPFVDLNELPDVPYHLMDVYDYLPMYKGVPTIYLQTSRGCPYGCTYCYNPVYNRRTWRALSADKTIERIKRITNEFNVRGLYLIDDNFFVDMNRAFEIVNRIIDERLDIEWQVQGVNLEMVDGMSDEQLMLLKQSGCIRMTFGVESGSERILHLMRKRHNVEQALRVNRRLGKLGIISFYSFIAGLPGEDESDLRATVRLMLRLTKENPIARTSPVYVFIPYPGTEMFDLSVKHGYTPPSDLEGWADHSWENANLPYDRKKREMLESLYWISIFIDRKFEEYDTSSLIKLGADLYRPIARYQIRNVHRNRFFGKIIRMMAERGGFRA